MSGDIWQLASVAGKWFGLLGVAGVTGGSFSLCLARYLAFPALAGLANYVLASAVFGICATALFFLAQIGAINQNGLPGMFDTQMGSILLQSSLGNAIGLRMLGFALLVFNCLVFWRGHKTAMAGQRETKTDLLLPGIAIALLCISFALTGHTSTLDPIVRSAIVLHVLAAFLWIGSLYPLLYLSRAAELVKVKQLMRCFGKLAVFMVVALVLAGLLLLTQLLQSFGELLSTGYGLTMLLKLAAVTVLLLFAGINKLRLVPRLTQKNSVHLLRASIRAEIGLALGVLVVTAWLTTVVGPANS
jgi:putative copper resistance protein D